MEGEHQSFHKFVQLAPSLSGFSVAWCLGGLCMEESHLQAQDSATSPYLRPGPLLGSPLDILVSSSLAHGPFPQSLGHNPHDPSLATHLGGLGHRSPLSCNFAAAHGLFHSSPTFLPRAFSRPLLLVLFSLSLPTFLFPSLYPSCFSLWALPLYVASAIVVEIRVKQWCGGVLLLKLG